MNTDQTSPARLILILGGARSGKSAFAERLAMRSNRSVAYIATAMAGDDEMRERIARHREARPAAWHTIEEPLDLAGAVRRASELADILLLDCMTLWLNNLYGEAMGQRALQDESGEQLLAASRLFDNAALQEVEKLFVAVQELEHDKTLLVVSNEVGSGIVPAYALGRLYRDTLGFVNQRLAQAAEKVYLMVAGLGIDIKRLHEEATF